MVAPDQAEIKNHEPVPEEVIFGYLDGVGNYESKNLLASLVLTNPQHEFTNTEARREMNLRQGDRPAWSVGPTSAQQFFGTSLERVGAVVKTQVQGESGKVVNAWRASDEYLDTKLALSGFISDWSLRWPNLSIQQVFGATTSRSDIRSPQVRSQLYWGLLTSGNGTTFGDLHDSLYFATPALTQTVNNQVRAMRDLGILSVVTKKDGYDPDVEIVDDNFRHVAMKLENRVPETQALYAAVKQLGRGTRLTLNSLADAAYQIDPTIDLTKVRHILMNGTMSGRQVTGVKLVDAKGIDTSSQSNISLAEGMTEPISELMEGIEAIRMGYSIEKYIARAREILDNPTEFSALMRKAAQFSPLHKARQEDDTATQQLMTVVQELGTLTTRQAQVQLTERYGRELDRGSVAQKLRDLVKLGKLVSVKLPDSAYYAREHNHYSLPPEQTAKHVDR